MNLWRKVSCLLLLVVLVGGAQDVKTTDSITAQKYEIGKQLMCQCGCGSTVADCNMLYCHGRDPINQKIEEGLLGGKSAGEIIQGLIAEFGETIRTAPPPEGFGAVGWAMPFVALGMGFLIAPFIVRRWRRNQLAADAAAPTVLIDEETVRRYEAMIEKDLDENH